MPSSGGRGVRGYGNGRRRARAYGAVVAVALVATACAVRVVPTSESATTSPTTVAARPPVTVGSTPLGVNVAAWDALYSGATAAPVDGLLEQAGLRLLRYPGGSWADTYHWATDTDTSACTGTGTGTVTGGPSCTAPDPLGFDAFAAQARSAGASTFVTVDYGSGTPAEAASWVAHARGSATTAVDLWEVGNESYSCYETDLHLAQPPTSIHGPVPGGAYCPPTAAMTRSYVAHAGAYLRAMRRADPRARIGIPWAFSGAEAGGAGVADADTWNTAVLHAFHAEIGFVDAHWYPIDQVAGLSDQQIIDTVRTIAPAATHLREVLHREAKGATFVVGETNISERPTSLDFEPIAALFAAATTLEWLTQGATGVVWWDLNNYGSPATGEFGLISSGGAEPQPAGTPYPPYYGEQLASLLTDPGSHLVALSSLPAAVLGFRSDQGDQRHVLLVNSGGATTVQPGRWFGMGATVYRTTYSAASATEPSPLVSAAGPAATGVELPATSVVVLSGAGGNRAGAG